MMDPCRFPVMSRLVGVAACVAMSAGTAFAEPTVAYIELEGTPGDRPLEQAAFLFEEADPTLTDYIRAFERIALGEEEVEAVVLRLREPMLSLSDALELGDAIAMASEEDVPVHVFSENYGPVELLLASHADEVIIQQGGGVSLPGLYSEEMYLADALEWMGITPQFVQIGDYKGASDALMNSEPSRTWEENISRLLDELYAAMRGPILEGRDLSPAQLDAAMDQLVFALADRGIELGLIDLQLDRPELDEHIAEAYGDDFVYDDEVVVPEGGLGIDLENAGFFEVFAAMQQVFGDAGRAAPERETIAVLHVEGPIVDGRSSLGGLTGSATVGALTVREALAEIADEEMIEAVVVRIDSPGGSATASENMYQGLLRVREAGKIVIASVGDMAASGGYYVACGAEELWVNDASIVGSIGVVGGKLAVEDMLSKLNLNVVGRSRGPRADMLGTSPWDASDLAVIRTSMQDVYDLFTDRVASARDGIDLSRTAEGRLFAGRAAIDLNMADELGSLADAIDALAEKLDLEPGDYDVRHYPEPPTFAELIEESFAVRSPMRSGGLHGASAFAGVAVAGSAVLGEQRWGALAAQMEALLLLRDRPVVLTSPRAILLR